MKTSIANLIQPKLDVANMKMTDHAALRAKQRFGQKTTAKAKEWAKKELLESKYHGIIYDQNQKANYLFSTSKGKNLFIIDLSCKWIITIMQNEEKNYLFYEKDSPQIQLDSEKLISQNPNGAIDPPKYPSRELRRTVSLHQKLRNLYNKEVERCNKEEVQYSKYVEKEKLVIALKLAESELKLYRAKSEAKKEELKNDIQELKEHEARINQTLADLRSEKSRLTKALAGLN